MSKHTPGPWTIGGELISRQGTATEIASVWSHHHPDRRRDAPDQETADANARLIAAAPLLLETSAELIRVIDALREANVLGDWPVVREALQGLRAAIAKAEGQQ